MAESPSFLDLRDREKFSDSGRFIPRSAARISVHDRSRSDTTKLLADAVLEPFDELSKLERNRFRCCSILVADDDGMTWSAESVVRALSARQLPYKLVCVPDFTENKGLPAIAAIVGKPAFCRLAAKRGITKRFWTMRPWMTPAIIAASVLLGALTSFLQILSKSAESAAHSPAAIMTSPWLWATSVALAASGVVKQWISKRQELEPQSRSIRELREALDEPADPDSLAEFKKDLLSELKSGTFPRAIIFDNYEALDRLSKDVFEDYLSTSRGNDGAEFWVVFDHKMAAGLTSWILTEKTSSAAVKSQFWIFEQTLLTEAEKQSLISFLGLGEEAAEFATVKMICTEDPEAEETFEKLFQDWRDSHPVKQEQYTDLDFLYLLSATATPGHFFLSPHFVRSKFIEGSETLKGIALKLALPGTQLESDEFGRRCSNLLKEFPNAVMPSRDALSFRVWPEAATVLARRAEVLGLKPEGLIHFFWCLFWRQIYESRDAEAFWVRKITHHLERADTLSFQQPDLRSLAKQDLLRISCSNIDGTLETCLFKNTMRSIGRAYRLIRDGIGKNTLGNTLLRKIWECYAFLGESSEAQSWLGTEESVAIETILSDLHSAMQPVLQPIAAPTIVDPSIELFVNSLSSEGIDLETFRTRTTEWLLSPERGSASDYAKARAAWLSFTLCPMLAPTERSSVAEALNASISDLDGIEARILDRLMKPQVTSSRTADMVSLSLTLWCQGLLVSFREKAVDWKDYLENLSDKDAIRAAETFAQLLAGLSSQTTAFGRNYQLKKLAAAALKAVQVADEIRRKPSNLAPPNDIFSRALGREICASALSSLLTACYYLKTRHSHPISDEVLSAIGEVFRFVDTSLSYPLPRLQTVKELYSPEVVNKVDELLKLCVLVWDVFGLTQLRDLLNLRRVHFFAICRRLQPDDYAAFRKLMESCATAIERRNFVGLIANCILADCLEPSAELMAHYLCKAGDVALAGGFGVELKRAFAIVAVEKAHALGFDLSNFLAVLVEPDKDGARFLYRHLTTAPEDQIVGIVLNFLNASRSAAEEGIRSAVRAVIADAVPAMQSLEVGAEVLSLLELHGLQDEFRRGNPIDVHALVAEWAERKAIWLYAWLLDMLITHGHDSEGVIVEAANTLRRNPDEDRFNSYYLLALAVGDRLDESDAAAGSAAAEYIQSAVHRWEGMSPAEVNTRAYMALCRLYPARNTEYMSSVVKWQSIHLHREHLRRLPNMVREGQYFLIFKDHFQWMQFWGLQTEVSREEYIQRMNVTPDNRARVVDTWRSQGGIVAEPITRSQRRTVVSADFLAIGSLLFTDPIAGNPAYVEDRRQFNETARANLQNLLGLIETLPTLPRSIRELLETHSQRLYGFSLPTGLGNRPPAASAKAHTNRA